MAERSERAITLKRALVEVALITVGVLIALSFDGILSWRKDRALVREARANLASEIRDNRDELQKNLKEIPKSLDNLIAAVAVTGKIARHESIKGAAVQVALGVAQLQNASRSTADITGAFALMPYDEVKRYASVYHQQEQFLRLQDETLQHITRALGLVHLFAEPSEASPGEVEELSRTLRFAAGSMNAQQQWGEALVREYDRILQQP